MTGVARLLPQPTARLGFREMDEHDLDDIAAMLGDQSVMAFYPAPKTRAESAAWIADMRRRYDDDGHALWIIQTHDGEFVGDCGLTWQSVNGSPVLEVGYHVRAEMQRRGFATEAARACVDLARCVYAPILLTAIIHPENTASRRVAENLGMTHIDDDHAHPGLIRTVMGIQLDAQMTR